MSVPLIIGITGHRDLIDKELPLLMDRVRAFFTEIRDQFDGLPLNVLSPLAEGADQLVAEVALSMDIPVIAVLPSPQPIYEGDMEGEALTTFRRLLSQCRTIELPMVDDATTPQGDDQYIALAGYLAAHSHILLALWDGEETHVPGGTSAVIHFHQHDTMSQADDAQPINPIDFIEDESDLVYHITCSRQSGPAQAEPGRVAWLTRDDVTPSTHEMPERYNLVFDRMIEYNRDIAAIGPSAESTLLTSDQTSPARVEAIRQTYSVADDLAGHFQSRMFFALRVGYGFALLAGLSFIVYADLIDEPLIIYTYLIAMVMVLVAFRIEAQRSWQRKHLDYRVLAEALRVQYYWQMAGVMMNDAFHYAHDRFHDRRDLQLGWVRHVMRHAALESDARLPEADSDDVAAVISSWIRDSNLGQASYYRAKALERAGKNQQTDLLEAVGQIVVFVIALLLILWPGELTASDLLIAIVGFIPFGIAVRQNFAHRIAERELSAQYQYFHRIFSSADELLNRTSRIDVQRRILRALGEAALDESSQWILRQRERPISSNGLVG